MSELLLENIGRPKRLRIPMPEGGGIVLLTGPNGAGKSTSLEAVQDAITGRKQTRSTVRDGAASGYLTGCGITMRVGRKVTRSGELTVETLDGGRLSIADVVSPPYKGAEEADRRRIMALVQLAGVEADPGLFYGLLSNFRDVVDVDKLNRDDILEMAAQVKRQIEESARKCEGIRDINRQQALACEEAAKGIPLDVETDAGVLQLNLEERVRRAQALISDARAAKTRNAAIAEARQKIQNISDHYGKVSLDEAQQRKSDAEANLRAADKSVAELEKQLENARHLRLSCLQELDAADASLVAARRHAATLADWQATIDEGELTGPTDAELIEADEAITQARQAIEAGAAARAAKEKLAKAESFRLVERVNEDFATKYRTAAAEVDNVLTRQIATLGCPLRVEAGRLVTDTDRGPTFYAELSDGERWKMAVQIAIKAVGENGLLAIPQAAFGEIQPRVRRELHIMAKRARVWILSAIATDDDDLDAVPFEELEAANA